MTQGKVSQIHVMIKEAPKIVPIVPKRPEIKQAPVVSLSRDELVSKYLTIIGCHPAICEL